MRLHYRLEICARNSHARAVFGQNYAVTCNTYQEVEAVIGLRREITGARPFLHASRSSCERRKACSSANSLAIRPEIAMARRVRPTAEADSRRFGDDNSG